MRAARWVRANDLAASGQHWTRARDLLVALPDSAEHARLLLEIYPQLLDTFDRLGVEPAQSEEVYLDAIRLAQAAGDRRTEGLIEASYASVLSGQSEIDAMLEHATRAAKLADAEGDRPVQLFARFALGRANNWKGRLRDGIRVFDEAEEIGGGDAAAEIEVLGWRPYLECLSLRSTDYAFQGRPRKALEFVERLPEFLRGSGRHCDLSSPAADRIWTCWVLGDAQRAQSYSSEALQIAKRFGADRNVVYGLVACGVASELGQRWQEGVEFFDRARERITATRAGSEWKHVIHPHLALCLAGTGDREQSLAMAKRSVEEARAAALDLIVAFNGLLRARVLRWIGGPDQEAELEAQISDSYQWFADRREFDGFFPHILLERATLSRRRGDVDGMTRDLAEAHRLFAEMGADGWEAYARSIEA